MILKSSLIDPLSRTVVVVCASPSSKDTEHTLNSLRYASVMENRGGQGSVRLLGKNRRGWVYVHSYSYIVYSYIYIYTEREMCIHIYSYTHILIYSYLYLSYHIISYHIYPGW
jgi:hypothetical protein